MNLHERLKSKRFRFVTKVCVFRVFASKNSVYKLLHHGQILQTQGVLIAFVDEPEDFVSLEVAVAQSLESDFRQFCGFVSETSKQTVLVEKIGWTYIFSFESLREKKNKFLGKVLSWLRRDIVGNGCVLRSISDVSINIFVPNDKKKSDWFEEEAEKFCAKLKEEENR